LQSKRGGAPRSGVIRAPADVFGDDISDQKVRINRAAIHDIMQCRSKSDGIGAKQKVTKVTSKPCAVGRMIEAEFLQ
jgi:hypothetical protein